MRASLPIDSFLPEILKSLREKQNLILTASPGAGKTTRLPPELTKLTDKKVLVLEPRRVAAVAAASRVAEENNWQIGSSIGYQVRYDNRTSPETRLIFLTEALLTKRLLQDAELKDVGIVVLDEFHERSLHVDLAIGLLKELQELARPDLKIVVMSATLDTAPLSRFLPDSAVVHVPGKIFPLEIQHSKEAQLLQPNFVWLERVTDKIKAAAMDARSKDILVFLPGVGEIERTFNELESWSLEKNLLLMKLHGSLDLESQKKVLRPQEQKKIILATNIAESSLTIDGVNTVIDTGLARQMSLHPKTGFPQLLIKRISKSSAIQRAGRAARQEAGVCYRLWAKMDELSMPDHETAEIFRSDLSETLLALSSAGVRDFKNFSWFEKPKESLLEKTEEQLQELALLNSQNEITELGRNSLKWPLPLRMAVLLEVAIESKHGALGALLAAILSERDFLTNAGPNSHDCDLTYRADIVFEYLKNGRISQGQRSTLQQVERSFDQLLKLAKIPRAQALKDIKLEHIPEIILESFTDRLARRRRANERSGLMIQSRGVSLDEKSQVNKAEFFIALQLVESLTGADTKVSLAAAIPNKLIQQRILPQAKTQTEIVFDEKTQKVLKSEFKSFHGLPLEEPRTLPVSADDAQRLLPDIALQRWDFILQKNEDLSGWFERYRFLKNQGFDLPDFDSLESRKEVLEEAAYGEARLEALFAKDLTYYFESRMSPEQKNLIQKEAPTHLQVPSGSRIRVHYPSDKNPYMEVRLQEVFGWTETPKILGGKIPVTLHLLGPNYRPVQVTQDLKSFWQNGYPEVRKEMRTRYPKHSWPEDPKTAPAVAKGRPTK